MRFCVAVCGHLTNCSLACIIALMDTNERIKQAQATEIVPSLPLELKTEGTDISSGLAVLRIPPFTFVVYRVELSREAPRGRLLGTLFGPINGSQRCGSRMCEDLPPTSAISGEFSDWPAVLYVEYLTLPAISPVDWAARDLMRCAQRVTLNPIARIIPRQQTWELGEICQQISRE